MGWSVYDWRLGRWAVRLVAFPLMQVARLGIWVGEQVARAALWLGADRRELDRLPPDVRERLAGPREGGAEPGTAADRPRD